MPEVVGRVKSAGKLLSKIGSWSSVAQQAAHTALDVVPHLIPLIAGDSV